MVNNLHYLVIVGLLLGLGYFLRAVLKREQFPRLLLVIDCFILVVQLICTVVVGAVSVLLLPRALELRDWGMLGVLLGLFLLGAAGFLAWLFRLKTYRENWKEKR